MPIYEYRCNDCGHELEAIQRISADPLEACPSCGENGLTRLISQSSFVLKGGGWYVTDYKKSSDGGETKSSGGGEAASDKASEPAETKSSTSDAGGAKSDGSSAATSD